VVPLQSHGLFRQRFAWAVAFTGVAWFERICAALGASSAATYRHWLASLAPDLLKGPFNHAARAEVGLSRELYDVGVWPEDDAKAVVPPAAAAGARQMGQRGVPCAEGPTAWKVHSSSSHSWDCGPCFPDGNAELLQELANRLEQMLQAEALTAGA